MFHENESETSYETTEIEGHAFVGAGLLAMQAPRYVWIIASIPSRASPLPQKQKKGVRLT